jgi:plastocyanin
MLAAAGCGSKDSTTTADPPNSTAQETTTSTAAPTGAPITNAITISTPGMLYDVQGQLRPGVAAITLANTSDQTHMMAMARLKAGVTAAQLTAALGQSEEEAGKLIDGDPEASYGSPAPVGPRESVTVTIESLPAGTYGIICFLSDKDGKPHWTMGMVSTFDVTGDSTDEKPDSDGTIELSDTSATLPQGFTGRGTFRVTNSGTTPHGLNIARLESGTTLAAFSAHIGQAQMNNASVDGGGGTLVGGIETLNPGQSGWITLDLSPGHYGFVSGNDAQGPELPPQHGEFDVR